MSKYNIGDMVQWYELIEPTKMCASPYNYANTVAPTFEQCYEGLHEVKDYSFFNSPIKCKEDTKQYISKKFGMITDHRQQRVMKSTRYNDDGELVCSLSRHAPNCSCVIPIIYTILNFQDAREEVLFEDSITPFFLEECD
jgi:hypothetical protein